MFAILGKYERARLPGQAVKTLASHAGIRGSIPLGVIWKVRIYGLFLFCQMDSRDCSVCDCR